MSSSGRLSANRRRATRPMLRLKSTSSVSITMGPRWSEVCVQMIACTTT